MPPPTRLREWLPKIAPAAVLFGLWVLYLWRYEPILDGHSRSMGGDYSYFLPRLLGDHFWMRLNGWWSVPWFSPAFCGGVPDWANPQSMPYSLPSWLVFWVDPVSSVQITFAASSGIGAIGLWLLLRGPFQTSAEGALVGAALFLFNGFYICRMAIGHLAFHSFVFAPLVAWLLLTRRHRWPSMVLAGVVVGLMIQSGIAAIFPPIVLSWLSLGLMRRPDEQGREDYWWRLGGALTIGLLLSASKIAAMASFSAQFPRDFYPLVTFRSPLPLLKAVLQSLFWRGASGDDASLVDSVVNTSVQERQFSLSPVVPLLLLAGVFVRRPKMTLRLGLLVGLLLIPLALNLSLPGWTQVLKRVPMLRSSLSLYRWIVMYLPLLAVAAALAVDRLPMRRVVAGVAILIAAGWSFTTDRAHYSDLPFAAQNVIDGWTKAQQPNGIPTIGLMDLQLRPDGRPVYIATTDDVMTLGANHVLCYEPLFGYGLEKLPWHALHGGSPLDEKNGWLNVLDPACTLFPKENGCRPGTPFPSLRRADAEAFLSWEPIPFARPLRQKVADAISLATLVGTSMFLLLSLWRLRKRQQQ